MSYPEQLGSCYSYFRDQASGNKDALINPAASGKKLIIHKLISEGIGTLGIVAESGVSGGSAGTEEALDPRNDSDNVGAVTYAATVTQSVRFSYTAAINERFYGEIVIPPAYALVFVNGAGAANELCIMWREEDI